MMRRGFYVFVVRHDSRGIMFLGCSVCLLTSVIRRSSNVHVANMTWLSHINNLSK